jgi:transposase-like protein
VISTTNQLESVIPRIRKVIKTRGHFPSDEAAVKLIWLALRNITAKWTKPAMHWTPALNEFAVAYGDRFLRSSVR